MHWTVKVDGGPRRVNHAAVELNGFIYSFGGFCSGEHHDGKIALDIHVLDTETYRWRKLQTRNEESMGSELSLGRELSVIPYQRYGHTVVAYQGKAYLWGGRNDTYGTSSKMHVFDPETCTWSLLDRVGQCPPARDGHSAVVYEDKMFIFGGFEDETQRFSQETYAFDFKTLQWTEIRATGSPPLWRDFHTACVLDSKMYIFGGRSDQLGQFHSSRDFYCKRLKVLDLKKFEWQEPNASGDCPWGRRSHSAWAYNGRMYIFGGYIGTSKVHLGDLYEFDPTKCRWRLLTPFGDGPSPRRRHCTVLVNDRLFLFGGTMPEKISKQNQDEISLSDLSDLYVLDYKPTLKTLAAVTVLHDRLHESCPDVLPCQLRQELLLMSQPNKITLPRHVG